MKAPAILLLALTASARADLVYSTYGTGQGYSGTIGYSVYGLTSYDGQVQGHSQTPSFRFTAPNDFTLDHIDVPLWPDAGLTMALLPDVQGSPATVNNALALENFGESSPYENVYSVSFQNANLHLQSGISYWIALIPASGSSAAWAISSSGGGTPYYHSSTYGATWAYDVGFAPAAFQIYSVPEPGSAVILLAGVAVVAWRRSRNAA